MDEFIATNMHAYGPFAVFLLLMLTGIGVPLGEELVTIPAGVLVSRGDLHLWPTIVATYLGVVASDLMWFGLCWHYGTRLLHKRFFKRLVHPRRLLEAKHQLERRGAWMIVMARFVPGSRTTAITVAGIFHMPFFKFAIASMSCVVVTAPLQIGIGFFSARVMGVRDTADAIQLIFGLMILAMAGTMCLGIWRQHRASGRRAPRAKARWLRRFRIRRHHRAEERVSGPSAGD